MTQTITENAYLEDPASNLIRCPSITPVEGGALTVLEQALQELGFTCHRLSFGAEGEDPVENLYARLGDQQPNFCFAGHTDVVPPGKLGDWQIHPFTGEIRDGILHGRGAADMKGAIAAFVDAVRSYVESQNSFPGSISLLITGDEEGPAINGTRKVLQWMSRNNEIIDACLVGEPTNPTALGEMVKVGRRGSLNGILTVHGTQGHVAYPHLANNPLPHLVRACDALIGLQLDNGSDHFQPSNLEITSIETGNDTSNVIPASAYARFNIRFNDLHSSETLIPLIHKTLNALDIPYNLQIRVSGESFLTPPSPFTELVKNAVTEITGQTPEMSTSGGTSDARFIAQYAPVVEFGGVGKTMHKVDEQMAVDDLSNLSKIYLHILEKYFSGQDG